MTVIDYAHTPDALSKALSAVRPMAAVRGGRVLCVFGCGGDRDPGKRPIMGAIAAELADAVVLTSDNPRSELPLSILSQIRAGIAVNCHTVSVVAERGEAIIHTINSASINDVILIAGKGHETTQEIGGVLYPFSDKSSAQSALSAWSTQNREGTFV